MHAYTTGIAAELSQLADVRIAEKAKAYLRDQFEFFGLRTPLLRQVSKTYLKKGLPGKKEWQSIVRELWRQPEREFQYFGVALFSAMRTEWDEKAIGLIEFCLVNKSWWDSVDYIATELSGPYFVLFPGQIPLVTQPWNHSDNIWLQRSSLLFQLKYKGKTDKKLLSSYIRQLSGSDEFFVRKAIGWVLREYSKTDPAWVRRFVETNTISPLSRKEALKRIVK